MHFLLLGVRPVVEAEGGLSGTPWWCEPGKYRNLKSETLIHSQIVE